MAKIFSVGDAVFVPSQSYSGEIVEKRENGDCLVRYSVPFGRRPYYETWWPVSELQIKRT